jgi:hypothetical protein
MKQSPSNKMVKQVPKAKSKSKTIPVPKRVPTVGSRTLKTKGSRPSPSEEGGLYIDEAMIVKPASLSDLLLDDANANAGTKRGRDLLERSLENYGAGRSVLLDKHNRVIAGNKTVEAALEKGLGLRIVETDGSELIAVQRKDLDLGRDKSARELAIADNRVQQADLLWDADRIIKDVDAGLGLEGMFDEQEMELFRASLAAGEEGEDDSGSEADAPPSGVKVVQLFFNESNYPAFLAAVNELSERYSTVDVTSTVIAGVARQAEYIAAHA